MIKLINILSEIKVVSTKYFPKDREWVLKVNNIEESEKYFEILDKLKYNWNGDRENMMDCSSVFKNQIYYPLYICHILDGRGITYSNKKQLKYTLENVFTGDPIKINF